MNEINVFVFWLAHICFKCAGFAVVFNLSVNLLHIGCRIMSVKLLQVFTDIDAKYILFFVKLFKCKFVYL